mgnify:FL=1
MIENKNHTGQLHVDLQVIEVIAKETVDKIDGITLANNNALSMKTKGPLTVTINDNNQVSIAIDMIVDYGVHVGTITTLIQNKIVSALQEMLDMKNAMINIQVQGVNF